MNDPKTSKSLPVYDELFSQISQLVETSRNEVQRSVNTAMVQTYWHIGQMIFEHEQSGERRAAYGKAQLSTLSLKLTERFGKGFSDRNLRNMRSFHLAFPIWHTVCATLSWSHYRLLSRIENEQARNWYMQESCLPTEEELKKELERERALVELHIEEGRGDYAI